ncbi:MAG: hypothetical protein GY737_00395 [Desulfobacteraceae bacterium]|nr:hypothetical protein [Desulfobacteraceae bacterium]
MSEGDKTLEVCLLDRSGLCTEYIFTFSIELVEECLFSNGINKEEAKKIAYEIYTNRKFNTLEGKIDA